MGELSLWPAIPAPLFSDALAASNFTYAVPVGIPILSCPIPAVSTAYVLTQDFMQFAASYSALALSTAYPGSAPFSNYYLVEEGPRMDVGGGLVRWTRKYAQVPAQHDEWEMFAYPFPGVFMTVSGTNIWRSAQPVSVLSRLQHDYIKVPNASWTDPILGGSPINVTSAGVIPKIFAMQYVGQQTIGGATYGGIAFSAAYLNPAASANTWPTSDDYNDAVEDALTNGWSASLCKVVLNASNTLSGGPPATSGVMAGTINTGSSVGNKGQLPAEDSRLDRWMGNIYVRRTRFVLAQ